MPSTHLTRTVSSGGNRQKWTLSFWIKFDRVKTGSLNIFSANRAADGDYSTLYLDESTLTYYDYDGGTVNRLRTSRLFRDLNAWYHIVLRYDSTDGTADNRIRFYINGSQATDIIDRLNPSQNYNSFVNANTYKVFFGAQDGDNDGVGDRFGGSMSHIHLCDGYSYDASAFGEYDANGVWKIKTSPSVTYGTNGFFILKDGNSVTDQSGNGNNFTVGGGTLTNTEDSPSNVFATFNPLSTKSTLSYGNTEVEYGGSGLSYETSTTTLGMTSGKYYCETKITYDNNYPGFGIASTNSIEATKLESDWLGKTSNSYGYFLDGVIYNNGSTIASGQSTFATNDIMGMALDLDSAQNTLKFYKNGSLINTTNITTNSNGWFFGTTHNNTKTAARSKFNFGNGYFGTTAVSSAGTNASGIGIFEYDVPTGYTALSTKGLNE